MIIDCIDLKNICKNFEPLFSKAGISHHLSNIRISYLPDKKVALFVSTNGSIFCNVMLKVESEPNDDKFDFLVDGCKFANAIYSSNSNNIYIKSKGQSLIVNDKEAKSKFKFQTMPTDVFPAPIMNKTNIEQYSIDVKELYKIVSAIVDVANDSKKSDNVKQFGVFLEFKNSGLNVFNISGMRSFIISPDIDTGNSNENTICFDSREFRYIKQVVRLKIQRQDDNTKIVISIDKNIGIVSFRFSDSVIYLRKLSLRLPNIYNILNKNRDCLLTVEKATFSELLKKASLVEDIEAGQFVFMFIKQEDIIIRVTSKHDSIDSMFDSEMTATQNNGENSFFMFNASALMDSISVINDPFIELKIQSQAQVLNGESIYGWEISGKDNREVILIFTPMRVK